MNKLQTIFLILLFPIFCLAQKADSKAYVKALFENQTEIQWVKHYKGRIDDLNDVSVTLGFDGTDCKGQLTYLRSNTKFDLDGTLENRQLFLQELDETKKVSGTLKGELKGNMVIGKWKNYNGKMGGNLWLEETEKENKFPSYCGDNKWIRKYEGAVGQKSAEIILQKESSQKLSGIIFYERKNQSYALHGNIDEQNDFIIKVKDEKGSIVQTLEGNLQQDKLTIAVKQTSSKNAKTTLTPIEGLTIGCVEFSDYKTSYDITFPKTTNAAFNKQMQEETDAWVKACRNHSVRVKKENPLEQPKFRATERGYAWSEVDYFSKKIISGLMTFSNTWTPGQKIIAFNFDLENNNSIYLSDVMEQNKDSEKYIKNYCKREIKNHKLYGDDDFKKWIKKSDFPYFTIRKEGICFSTKFSMLYGRQSVTIPYQQLKPFLTKSFIKKMKSE